MINTKIPLERVLQEMRFSKVKKYLKGDVLDFGGNKGELRKFVKGNYTLINYDHSQLENNKYDTIVSLAVIEHIRKEEVKDIFHRFKRVLNNEGLIFITTPTLASKPVLETLALLRLLEKENIQEHKHYWSKKDIYELAERTGFEILKYKKFQFFFNQFAVLKHKKAP